MLFHHRVFSVVRHRVEIEVEGGAVQQLASRELLVPGRGVTRQEYSLR
jgi:hypothetical protein